MRVSLVMLGLMLVTAGLPLDAADMALPTVNELIKAVVANNRELVAAILADNPALANAADKAGATPLHHAAATRKAVDAAEALIFHKADVNAKKPDGVRPLHVACATGNLEIAKLLLSHGAQPGPADKQGRTPMTLAKDNLPILKLFEREWMAPRKPIISKNPKDGSAMAAVPAGKYTIGGAVFDEEGPVHAVKLDAFRIGRHEITVGQYKAFCKETGRAMPGAPKWGWTDSHPIVNVTWQDAADYCAWAGGRLPTESEWEAAARGTDERYYPWGEDSYYIDRIHKTRCNMGMPECDDGYPDTSPAGKFPCDVSPYGCLDMAGNVSEWCSDRVAVRTDGYGKEPAGGWINPTGPADGGQRIVRGGCFTATNNVNIHCSYRGAEKPETTADYIGFRLALPGGPAGFSSPSTELNR